MYLIMSINDNTLNCFFNTPRAINFINHVAVIINFHCIRSTPKLFFFLLLGIASTSNSTLISDATPTGSTHHLDRELGGSYLCFVYQTIWGLFLNDNILMNSKLHFLQKSAWTICHKSSSKWGTLKFQNRNPTEPIHHINILKTCYALTIFTNEV